MDHSRNIFVFERNLQPINEVQKFQLKVVAQINSGEEITAAIQGSINMQDSFSKDKDGMCLSDENEQPSESKKLLRQIITRDSVSPDEHMDSKEAINAKEVNKT